MILVVLSHFPDLFRGFIESLDAVEPLVPRLLIRDGDLIQGVPPGWEIVDAPTPFNYARNVNIAWRLAGGSDVILCGDDVRFSGKWVRTLRDTAYADDKVGVSCAQLWGQSPFVCGYFKHEIIASVGLMDERYTGYGREDMDWCRRMEALGYHTQPVVIPATHNGGTSFWRREVNGEYKVQDIAEVNNKLFEEKWGK